NGNGIGGSAATAASGLRTLGYPTTVEPGAGGSADNSNYANTHIVYRADRDADLAESVAKLFTGATTEKSTGTIAFTQRLLVIVGKTGSTPIGGTPAAGSTVTMPEDTAENNKVPEKQTALVVVDTYGAATFQELRGKVKMPILYPSMRESSSSYDDGVYVYKIPKGHNRFDAYRMVAKTGVGDYWGFQATTWATPPVLDDPTRTLVRGNRTYRLYFNGTKLHIVAWKQGSGTYWITNTLLDKLSNETMLAIAQGVKRVPSGQQ
ncbi:MAG: LytR C-terminal domain-containing protein, partial [Thermoleophilia bacterium]|nr:LytR C-terminal domain-containing protein [Thermoleophilia bacterium]